MPCPWDQFAKEPHPFCEEQLCHIVAQPANTWSNIGYFILIYFLLRAPGLGRKKYLFAGVSFCLGVGSTLFHMSNTIWAKKMDVGGMLMLSALMLTLALSRFIPLKRIAFIFFYAIFLIPAVNLIDASAIGTGIFLGQSLVAAVLEFAYYHKNKIPLRQMKILGQALVIFLIALFLNVMDLNGVFCDPANHILNVHAVWHLATAYCIYLIGIYYSRDSVTATAPAA